MAARRPAGGSPPAGRGRVGPLDAGTERAGCRSDDAPGPPEARRHHAHDAYRRAAHRGGVARRGARGTSSRPQAAAALTERFVRWRKASRISRRRSPSWSSTRTSPGGKRRQPADSSGVRGASTGRRGRTTKEIAGLLDLTVKTAESYRARIMEKLDIHDTAGLVRYAIRRGVIQP